MLPIKTDLKCCGCKRDLPEEGYNDKTQRATWFGIYVKDILLDWVCVDCWDKGVRYKGFKETI